MVFSVEISFSNGKYSVQLSAFLFFVLKLPMTPRVHKSAESLVSCVIHVFDVTAVGKPEVAGSNIAIDHLFCVSLDTR